MPLKAFLLDEKDNIDSYSFITVCGGAKGQKEKVGQQLNDIIQKKPDMVTELWINDLLTPEKKDTIKYAMGYRIQQKDLEIFDFNINEFLKRLDSYLVKA